MSDRRNASTGTPAGCSRSPGPRARSTRSRTSCSASPARYESSDELRNTLTDDQIPPAKRQAIVEDLLGGKATPTTVQLISMVVGAGHGRDLPAIVDRMVERAASSKDLALAEVRSAVELTPDQQDRLKAALANATGKDVDLKVVVDPSVLGGLVATVGDTVIDGTVRTHLDQLKGRL